MIADKKTYTTIPVSDLERARKFYRDLLGIREDIVTEGGVMYGSGGTQFFVFPSRYRAAGHTQMSWQVGNIKQEVAELKEKGIKFEEFDLPGIKSVEGIVQSGPTVWTAWFKDPDGNLLGLTQVGQTSQD
jgi:catechol 2,3-dioxygenase-like lactoylglutathione lyase family enzyme